ncbi:hypothetical protein [Klebsiella phage ST13-OXA48phi12.4]|nr:hypothetical protein [Klebsiella phage ST13-OXA48phi12.4]
MITISSNMSHFWYKVRVSLLYLACSVGSLKFDDKRPC